MRKAIRDLAYRWHKLGIDLPRPLAVSHHIYRGKEKRHFHVLAIRYNWNERGSSTVEIPSKFRKAFDIDRHTSYRSKQDW